MKKDIEWLIERLEEEYEHNKEKHNKEGSEGYTHRLFTIRNILYLIEQLDEPETLSLEWLDDYEAEEEQKYRVVFPSVDKFGKGFNYLAKDCYNKELWVEDARTDGLAWEERSSFTEDEIRDLDKGDILFEHFAVKVEELEE